MDLSKNPKDLSLSEDEYVGTAGASTAEGADAGDEGFVASTSTRDVTFGGFVASTSTQDVTSDCETEPYSPGSFQPILLEEQSEEEEENNETDDEKRTRKIKIRGQKWRKNKNETSLLILAPPISPLSSEGSPRCYHEENYPPPAKKSIPLNKLGGSSAHKRKKWRRIPPQKKVTLMNGISRREDIEES